MDDPTYPGRQISRALSNPCGLGVGGPGASAPIPRAMIYESVGQVESTDKAEGASTDAIARKPPRAFVENRDIGIVYLRCAYHWEIIVDALPLFGKVVVATGAATSYELANAAGNRWLFEHKIGIWRWVCNFFLDVVPPDHIQEGIERHALRVWEPADYGQCLQGNYREEMGVWERFVA